jgi:hypothetical protein
MCDVVRADASRGANHPVRVIALELKREKHERKAVEFGIGVFLPAGDLKVVTQSKIPDTQFNVIAHPGCKDGKL